MSSSESNLKDRVVNLSDDASLEAVNLLAGAVLGATSDSEALVDVAEAVHVPTGDVSGSVANATPQETANMARLVLLAAVDAGRATDVEAALDAVGEKAFVVEIAVVGLLALAILHTVLTRGAKATSKEVKVTTNPDGSVTYQSTDKTENFSVGQAIASLAQKILAPLS